MDSTEAFLREFNEAWARADTAAILDAVTDDIHFRMASEPGVKGREAFANLLREMSDSGNSFSLDIHNIIIQGKQAALAGEILMTDRQGESRTYAFCDVYGLRGSNSPKVASLTAYVMEGKAENEGGAA